MRTNPRGATGRSAPDSGPAGPTVTESVVQRLEELVFGALEPGAELPSESDLASQLGVSRLTVREATKALQARGLIEVRQGRRPMVAHPSAGPIGDYFMAAVRRDPRQLMDLLEVRRALEVHIASLAATRAGRVATNGMGMALAAMREATGDPLAFHDADVRFHESIAAGTGNQMLSFLIEALEEPLHASRMRSIGGHLARGATMEDLIEQHARIFERVEARDPDGAAAAMRDHLDQTARDLRAAFALGDGVDTADGIRRAAATAAAAPEPETA